MSSLAPTCPDSLDVLPWTLQLLRLSCPLTAHKCPSSLVAALLWCPELLGPCSPGLALCWSTELPWCPSPAFCKLSYLSFLAPLSSIGMALLLSTHPFVLMNDSPCPLSEMSSDPQSFCTCFLHSPQMSACAASRTSLVFPSGVLLPLFGQPFDVPHSAGCVVPHLWSWSLQDGFDGRRQCLWQYQALLWEDSPSSCCGLCFTA